MDASTRHRNQRITIAIKELREHLGDSQQAFATRLKLSVRAIANYESGRFPTYAVIGTLAELADEVGCVRAARTLTDVIITDLKLTKRKLSYFGRDHLLTDLKNEEERAYAMAFLNHLLCLRSTDPAIQNRAKVALSALHKSLSEEGEK